VEYPETNMIVQTPYKKKLRVGDIFILKYPSELFLFGRIMKLDADIGGFPNCIKVHIYNLQCKSADLPDGLINNPLLIAPVFLNRLGFSRGYMPIVANVEVEPHHNNDGACYIDVFPKKRYVNELGEDTEKTDSVGAWGLSNYRTLDDDISIAIGIPEASE